MTRMLGAGRGRREQSELAVRGPGRRLEGPFKWGRRLGERVDSGRRKGLGRRGGKTNASLRHEAPPPPPPDKSRRCSACPLGQNPTPAPLQPLALLAMIRVTAYELRAAQAE